MKLNQLRKESLHFVFIKYVASKYKKIIFNLKSIYVFSKVRLDAEQSKYFIADKNLTYQCMIIGRRKRHLVAKR